MSNLSDALRQLMVPGKREQEIIATAVAELDRAEGRRAGDHEKSMAAIQGLSDIFRNEKAAWNAEREKLNQDLTEALLERDEYHEIADRLANAIADYFLVEIGEHSSSNCPWMCALDVIENPPSPTWADYETRMALASAPKSIRDYVVSLERSAGTQAKERT